jgi:general secretion pathway protein A
MSRTVALSALKQEHLNIPMTQFFELKKAPFPQMVAPKEMLLFPHLKEVAQMIEFAFQHHMFYAIIGAVGCGKSSALMYSCERLTSKQAKILTIVGGMWSFTELMRQILAALGTEFKPYQPAVMVRLIQDRLQAIHQDGKKCIIIIDEAHLLRADAFAQLHILGQSPESEHSLFSLMLCGQEELAEKISTPQARPLLSRIAEGYYVSALSHSDFYDYIDHHMKLAGANRMLFDELGLEAVWQGSNANLRSIGNCCLAAMQYAANNDVHIVNAECVRKSQKPWWFDSSKQQPLP